MFSKFFIDRPRFAMVVCIVLALAGIISIFSLPIAQYPDVAPPQIRVSTTYRGADAQTIANTLCELDFANAPAYQENAASYIAQLKELYNQYKDAVNNGQHMTILFADRFPFRYLADDYGLTYFAAFAGCSAETEASFETIAFLARKVDELQLPVVLTIEGANHAIAETVVSSTQAKNQAILTMNSMQSVTAKDAENGESYLGIMAENLNVLKEALN